MSLRSVCLLFCFIGLLCLAAVGIAASSGDPIPPLLPSTELVLVYHPARHIHASLKSKVTAPGFDPREWQVFGPVPPVLRRQRLHARFLPEGKILADASPAHNGTRVFSAIIPGAVPPEFETDLDMAGELYAVDLLPRGKTRNPPPPDAFLSPVEHRAFLAPSVLREKFLT